jgi:CDP-glucose 4,6-dehydratase
MVSTLNSLSSSLNGPVLVTGHTGFKGTWLTLLLEKLGVEVIGFSLEPEKNSLYTRIRREGKILEQFADVRNISAVRKFIENNKPVAVIHLAAQPLVLESFKSPRDTFDTNVMGTVNLLDSSFMSKSVKAFLAITTDKVYQNENKGLAFKESDALAGKDPYSASKVGAESAVDAWQQISISLGGPRVTAIRSGNVIGGGDWAKNRLIPDLIRGFSQNDVVRIRNPLSTRPWQHVLDPLIGYLMTLQEVLNGRNIDSINFGPTGSSMTVHEVVEIAKQFWGGTVQIAISETKDAVYEARALELDSSLAKQLLNWKPIWSQKQSVEATLGWWKNLIIEKQDPLDLCLSDVELALNRVVS